MFARIRNSEVLATGIAVNPDKTVRAFILRLLRNGVAHLVK
jgi:hypothetical protein